jgi:Flp pilus assembly pilin Flp
MCEEHLPDTPKGVRMLGSLKNFLKEESGQDLIEYALIGLIIALGALAGMGTVASSINAEFSKIAGELS